MSHASRELGSFERAQVQTSYHFAFNLVAVIRISGPLRLDDLRGSLDQLQSRHALLRCRVIGPAKRPSFELADIDPIPLDLHDRADDESWRPLVEKELVRRFDLALGPLLRCNLLSDPDGSHAEIVLTIHHAIIDAQSVLQLMEELLAVCGGEPQQPEPSSNVLPASSAVLPATSGILPASSSDHLPPPFRAPRCWGASARFLGRQLADEVSYRWRRRGHPRPAVSAPFNCQILPVELPETETRALVRASRRNRVGMLSVLNAAMLLAVARRRYGSRPVPHRYFAMADLRPYLDPPVPSTVLGSYISMVRLTLPASAESDLWKVAAKMHDQIEQETRRGAKFLSARWADFSMRTLLGQRAHRMSTIAINYAGAPALRLEYGALKIESLHAFVANFPHGPEYTGQMRVLRGRLLFDFLTLDVDMDRAQTLAIAREMIGLLERAGESDG